MDNFIIAKATDVGITRQINEDSLTVFDSPNGQVLVVCDGMGGQAAGDVASQLAVSIIESILTDNTFSTPEEAIRSSVMAANQGVIRQTAQRPETSGMGSTCVMLIIKDGKCYCGWVGDSRIYYVANHTIRQISHDQSYVQQLVDSGQLSADQAALHPQKNEITNCIGLENMTPPEILPVPIVPEPGSVFLLCSDGLSGMVDDQQIERVVSGAKLSLQQKADRLIQLANQAGGVDNISVVMVQFGTAAVSGATSGTLFQENHLAEVQNKKGNKLRVALAALSVVLVAAGGGFYYVQKQKEAESQKTKTESKARQTKKDSRRAKPADVSAVKTEGEPSVPQRPAPPAGAAKQPRRADSGAAGSIRKTVKDAKKDTKNPGNVLPNPTVKEPEPQIETEEQKARRMEEEEKLKEDIRNNK